MKRLGMIDIGSNSIRLVVYEMTERGAYRVIDESKESARLSARMDGEGRVAEADLQYVAETLQRFRLLCGHHGAVRIRTVATAAVRNSRDTETIVAALEQRTGLHIEVLSGEEEARLGFLGMINSIDIDDGFLIDIGGGSTEVLLFRNRDIVRSVSFPFGAVNTLKRFGVNGDMDSAAVRQVADMVGEAAGREPWIAEHPGLPLVGLGGTVRSLCKMDQRSRNYSLSLMHYYHMSAEVVGQWLLRLGAASVAQRKRIDGLSKDRADIILPGVAILHTVFRMIGASRCIVSGAGLRDGMFYETIRPSAPRFNDVLEHSVHNLLALHPSVSLGHVRQVERLAAKLFADLGGEADFGSRAGTYLRVAALLYRIGISVNYYQFQQHTYYVLAHSRVDGLSHREILLCALIASFKSEKRLKPAFATHRDLLADADFPLIVKLGSLLQVAVALDRSETQPLAGVAARTAGSELIVEVLRKHAWDIEKREVELLAKEFHQVWGLKLRLAEGTSVRVARFEEA